MSNSEVVLPKLDVRTYVGYAKGKPVYHTFSKALDLIKCTLECGNIMIVAYASDFSEASKRALTKFSIALKDKKRKEEQEL